MAPVALLNQWQREIQTRIRPEYELSTHIYHGITGRKKFRNFQDISKYDIILTTYGTLSREYKEHFGFEDAKGLRSVKPTFASPFFQRDSQWYRIVLDEAQYIKNKNTLASKACAALECDYRWCLSGTPMQNNVLELYSLIRFLRIKPYDDQSRFNREIGTPLQKSGSPNAMKKLQALLKAIMLRRTKSSEIDGKPILQLPPKEIEVENTQMDQDETEFYKALEAGAQAQMNKYINSNTVMKNYSNILVLLLRLRQACCHPKLIERAHKIKARSVISARSNKNAIQMCRRFTQSVVQKLEHKLHFTCPRCDDAIDRMNVVLFFPCGDFICSECCENFFDYAGGEGGESEVSACPGCDRHITEKDLIDFTIFEFVHIEKWTDAEIAGHMRAEKRAEREARTNEREKRIETWKQRKITVVESDDDYSDDESFMFRDTSKENKLKLLKAANPTMDAQDEQLTDSKPTSMENSRVQSDSSETEGSTTGTPQKPEPTDGNNALVVANSSDEKPANIELEKDVGDVVPTISENNRFNTAVGNEDNMLTLTAEAPLVRHDIADIFPNGWISSCKVEKCLALISEIREKFPGEKVIVFSQFTSLLDFIEVGLDLADRPNYLRYDGSMSSGARNQCIIDFFDKTEIDVLLISLKAGNVGLTLTCASHIIIMDPFWNPFVEDQAMDRAHRIGQMRPVFVHRLVIEGTVEDRIVQLQKKKKELIDAALDEKGLQSIGRLNQRELMFLFGLSGSR